MVCQWKLWVGAKRDFLLRDSMLILLNGISPIYVQRYLSTNKRLMVFDETKRNETKQLVIDETKRNGLVLKYGLSGYLQSIYNNNDKNVHDIFM